MISFFPLIFIFTDVSFPVCILVPDLRDTLAKSLKIGVLPNEGYLMKQKLDTKTDLKFLSDL
jgi:hypothetical protein